MGLVVGAHGLNCPRPYGISVPPPGIRSPSPVLEGGFLTPGPPGSPQSCILHTRRLLQHIWAPCVVHFLFFHCNPFSKTKVFKTFEISLAYDLNSICLKLSQRTPRNQVTIINPNTSDSNDCLPSEQAVLRRKFSAPTVCTLTWLHTRLTNSEGGPNYLHWTSPPWDSYGLQLWEQIKLSCTLESPGECFFIACF